MTWNHKLSLQAWEEGWDVFNAGDDIQIQRIDDPESILEAHGIHVPALDNDADAWKIVFEGVQRGSALHLAAWEAISDYERECIQRKMAE